MVLFRYDKIFTDQKKTGMCEQFGTLHVKNLNATNVTEDALTEMWPPRQTYM